MTRAEQIFAAFKAEVGLGDPILEKLANIAAAACQESLEGYPKGAPHPSFSDEVQILCTEAHARVYEKECLIPRACYLAGPLVFDENDLPSYIIGIGAKP